MAELVNEKDDEEEEEDKKEEDEDEDDDVGMSRTWGIWWLMRGMMMRRSRMRRMILT